MITKIRKRNIINDISFVVLTAIVVFAVLFFCSGTYKAVTGSPDCIIEDDYTSLTLFGERYVPLVFEDAYCQLSDIIVMYAQVKDSTFFDRLFFGVSIYSVAGCTNNEVIILNKSGDSAHSYYCLESKYDEYLKSCRDDPYDNVISELRTEDSVYYSVVSNELAQVLKNCDFDHSVEIDIKLAMCDEKIAVSLCTENEIFRKNIGELVRYEDEYYFADNAALEGAEWVDGNPARINGYVIDDSYDGELDKLFSHKGQ
ncbi:MAG: hypothetical protein IJ386_07640 [Clostridia bacterium]|nr:hypothetical protein [Clostridia bacterium]